MTPHHLTSRSNPAIKIAAALKTSTGCRKKNRYLIEGPRFILDMLNRNDSLEYLVIADGAGEAAERATVKAAELGIRVITVETSILAEISSTEHSQGVIAVAPIPSYDLNKVFTGGTVLVLDRVSDPGNAGTAIRSAAAFGCSGVVFLKGSTFPWNPKVTRSSAGLNAAIPIVSADSLPDLKKEFCSYSFLGAEAHGACVSNMEITDPLCLVIGSEAHGLSETTKSQIDGSVSIPMQSNVESLNAGVSASILLYDLLKMTP